MEKLTGTIIRAIQDKKGKNIVSLDLSKIDGAICSCFIVCNADSTTQVAAIAAGIEEQVLETLGEKVWRVEGQQNALWIAMDYVDVVYSNISQYAVTGNARKETKIEDGDVVITSGNLNLADGTEVIPRARREKKMD